MDNCLLRERAHYSARKVGLEFGFGSGDAGSIRPSSAFISCCLSSFILLFRRWTHRPLPAHSPTRGRAHGQGAILADGERCVWYMYELADWSQKLCDNERPTCGSWLVRRLWYVLFSDLAVIAWVFLACFQSYTSTHRANGSHPRSPMDAASVQVSTD